MKAEDYRVAWICALPLELAAAEGMLDELHGPIPESQHDDNAYSFGKIGEHNVVLACLPTGVTGVSSAAVVAEKILHTFRSLKVCLMVGIGGGVPSEENDIRLGDVVISKPTDTEGGVIQYDFGKTIGHGIFKRTGMLNRPPDALLGAVSRLQATHIRHGHHILKYLDEMIEKYPRMRKDFSYLGAQNDQLFEADYDHVPGKRTCADCDMTQVVVRVERSDNKPELFYGLIASGNQVMRHGSTRDRFGDELGIICFEMEAAGLMNRFPCLVIRGICDYADTHKNKKWQGYAAATAAGYAKELLYTIPVESVTEERSATQVAEVSGSSTAPNVTISGNVSNKGGSQFVGNTFDGSTVNFGSHGR